MLTHLTIKNYALIQHLELKPSSHLNVITGETGAGKSIMLGAIGLLLGNRADTKVLWDENEKCIAEATFDIKPYRLNELFESENLDYENETVLRREVSSNGKSRAFINDTPVTLDVMRKIGSRLMDVHSQHETLELGSRNFQLSTIDLFAGNAELKGKYSKAWNEYVTAKKRHDDLVAEAERLKQEAEFVQFQLDELTKAQLEDGQQEHLESELKIREHAEDIKGRFNQVLSQLSGEEYSSLNVLSNVRNELSHLTEYSEKYKVLYERIHSAYIELSDVLGEIEREEAALQIDPEKTEEIKEKLSQIYHLMQKHRVSAVSSLLEIQDRLQQQATKTANVDAALEESKKALQKATSQLHRAAGELSESRKKVFDTFGKRMVDLLGQLGIPQAQLNVTHEAIEPGADGTDRVEFHFSANKGLPMRPLSQVASGGEFSRLMFCLKYLLAEKTALPTLVLDEIDTGVSGEIAIQLGRLMQAMANKHQLITITHLPQIAAKAEVHFYAYKEIVGKKTVSQIRSLGENERIEEIAKMIGGANPSALARENARELIST